MKNVLVVNPADLETARRVDRRPDGRRRLQGPALSKRSTTWREQENTIEVLNLVVQF